MIQNPLANLTPVVKNLLIINLIFFLARFTFAFTLHRDLDVYLGAFYPGSPYFKMWQIISYMFMHGSFMHIFSNMLGLLFIGPMLEYTFGQKRFLQYYFLTGLGALAMQYLVQAIEIYHFTGAINIDVYNYQAQSQAAAQALRDIYSNPIVGASGSIFGLLMAVYLLYPDTEVLLYFAIPVKIKYLVPVYVLFELYSGINPSQGDSVAHFAHLGGALIGFIVIKIWGYRRRNNIF